MLRKGNLEINLITKTQMQPKDMAGLVKGQPKFVSLWVDACMKIQCERDLWVASLRKMCVAAAHPDDGWVNREENRLQLVNPHFNDGVGVGSLVALGSPAKHRLVELIGSTEGCFHDVWEFKPRNSGRFPSTKGV